ncbi:Formin-like protein 11 [Linum grandiflorum]
MASSSSSFCSRILPIMIIIIIITIFILSASQNAHITTDSSLDAGILHKFRALLGSSIRRRMVEDENVSPSPSPSPSLGNDEGLAPSPYSGPSSHKAPAVAPTLPFHLHAHHQPLHHPMAIVQPHIQEEDRNKKGKRFRRAIVAIVASAGAALVVSVMLLIWFYGKFRKHQRGTGGGGALSVHSKKWRIRGKSKSKHLTSHSSGSQVNLNPGIDFLYQNPLLLGRGTEQESIPECVLVEETENGGENSCAGSSSTREIVSVHGDAEESVRYDSDEENPSCGEKIIPIECHSSDDESFHSFADSHSSNSNLRLSNASAGSLSEPYGSSPPPVESLTSMVSNIPEAKPAHSLSHGLNLDTNLPQSPSVERVEVALPKITSTFPNSSSERLSSSLGSNHIEPGNALPQKPLSGIPPPPCPPPFLKGNSSSNGSMKVPPPPPPSQLPQHTPLGKDGAPLPKLKPLHWDKVRAPPEQRMVWDKIRSSSFELDEEMIESLFGYNLRTMKTDEMKSKSPSPSNHVLDHKRLQNITILSKALNSTPEQVCNSLMRGDGLGLQQLEALARMVPTDEEQSKLKNYEGNINDLGSAERFVKTLLRVPLAFERVEAMLFRETFDDEVAHLRNSFSMLEEACKELRSSRLFQKLLEAVLKTGNRMNIGTIRGDARAFKLDTLLKLSDVKGTDNKTTLLHFVVQEICRTEGVRVSESIMGQISQKSQTKTIEQREENYRRMGLDLVSGLSTELYNVKKTATIDLDVLATSVSNLSSGISGLTHLVEKRLLPPDGGFVDSMREFLREAETEVKGVKEEEDRVMEMVKGVTEYFHGNVGRDEANPLRIFVVVRDFLGMLDHVCKELRSSKVASCANPLAPFR